MESDGGWKLRQYLVESTKERPNNREIWVENFESDLGRSDLGLDSRALMYLGEKFNDEAINFISRLIYNRWTPGKGPYSKSIFIGMTHAKSCVGK